jgi:hypothetical protein
MKTGHINLAVGVLSLACAVVYALVFDYVFAVIWMGVSVCWMIVGLFQIATSDDTEPHPLRRIARRFFRTIVDWI